MKRLTLLLLAAQNASALSTIQPRPTAPSVTAEIAASGATDIVTNCLGADAVCTIVWTPKPGKPAVFTDHMAARTALIQELNALEAKLDDNTATLADLRRAMKLVLKLSDLSKK